MVETLQQPKAIYFSVTRNCYINKLFLIHSELPLLSALFTRDMEKKYILLIPAVFYTETYVSSQSSFFFRLKYLYCLNSPYIAQYISL